MTRERLPGRLWDFAREFARFSLVGVLRTLVGIVLLMILPGLLGVDYIVSNVIVYSIGLIMGFLLHRGWVFRSRKMWRAEILPYIASFGIGYLANAGLLLVQVRILGMKENISQLVAMAGFTLVNFAANKLWTFRGGKAPVTNDGKE